MNPHPQWGLYQVTLPFLGRVRFVSWRETTPARTRMQLESGRFCFAASRSLSSSFGRKNQRLVNRA